MLQLSCSARSPKYQTLAELIGPVLYVTALLEMTVIAAVTVMVHDSSGPRFRPFNLKFKMSGRGTVCGGVGGMGSGMKRKLLEPPQEPPMVVDGVAEGKTWRNEMLVCGELLGFLIE